MDATRNEVASLFKNGIGSTVARGAAKQISKNTKHIKPMFDAVELILQLFDLTLRDIFRPEVCTSIDGLQFFKPTKLRIR